MSLDFEAFGRDVQSQADSAGDSALASAVKSFVQWFAGDAFPDGKWRVVASADGRDASLSFVLVEEGAYVAPATYEDIPATAEELQRSANASGPVDVPVAASSPADVPAAAPVDAPAPVVDAAPAEPAPAEPAAEVAPADPPVAAPSSDVSSEPQTTSSTTAPEYEGT